MADIISENTNCLHSSQMIISLTHLYLFIFLAFILGFSVASFALRSSNPYLSVIRDYVDLHYWHRYEALALTDFVQSVGLPISFTSGSEQVAMMAAGSTMVSGLSYYVGKTKGIDRGLL